MYQALSLGVLYFGTFLPFYPVNGHLWKLKTSLKF